MSSDSSNSTSIYVSDIKNKFGPVFVSLVKSLRCTELWNYPAISLKFSRLQTLKNKINAIALCWLAFFFIYTSTFPALGVYLYCNAHNSKTIRDIFMANDCCSIYVSMSCHCTARNTFYSVWTCLSYFKAHRIMSISTFRFSWYFHGK